MNFYTADTHFYHDSLLTSQIFSPRPQFLTVADMNETIINNWNAKVKPNDTVYHLGDIAMKYTKPASLIMAQTFDILSRLNGHIVLIKGNHDSSALFKYLAKQQLHNLNGQPKFDFHEVGVRLKFDHHEVFLTHYPMMLGLTKNQINLHGHIHNYSVHAKENINVGVDSPDIDYLPSNSVPFGAPLSENEVITIIAGKKKDYLQRV